MNYAKAIHKFKNISSEDIDMEVSDNKGVISFDIANDDVCLEVYISFEDESQLRETLNKRHNDRLNKTSDNKQIETRPPPWNQE